jgi:hypothetical protein
MLVARVLLYTTDMAPPLMVAIAVSSCVLNRIGRPNVGGRPRGMQIAKIRGQGHPRLGVQRSGVVVHGLDLIDRGLISSTNSTA